MTFDVTVKVEHLIEHAAALPRLRELGCLFVTSAFESCNDAVLERLDKGHTRADLERAVVLVRQAGLALRPTWVPFTPWSAAEDFAELLRFVEQHGLVRNVQPVQYALRLLVPPGSPLAALLRAEGRLGPFDPAGLTWTWPDLDPRTRPLRAEVTAIVEAGARRREDGTMPDPARTFAEVKRAALRALGAGDGLMAVLPQPREVAPGLSEPWFC